MYISTTRHMNYDSRLTRTFFAQIEIFDMNNFHKENSFFDSLLKYIIKDINW